MRQRAIDHRVRQLARQFLRHKLTDPPITAKHRVEMFSDEHLATLFSLVQQIGHQKTGLKPVLMPKPLQRSCRTRFGGLGGGLARKWCLLHLTDLIEHRMYVDEEQALAEQLWHPTIVSGELINEARKTCARRHL